MAPGLLYCGIGSFVLDGLKMKCVDVQSALALTSASYDRIVTVVLKFGVRTDYTAHLHLQPRQYSLPVRVGMVIFLCQLKNQPPIPRERYVFWCIQNT